MAHDTLDEGDAKTYRVQFTDAAGQAVAPSAVRYRIDCLTDGQVVRDETALTPAATVDIVLDANDNRMVTARARETHRLTVLIDDAEGGGPDSDYKDFDIRRKRY
jgi:hypothetical protein